MGVIFALHKRQFKFSKFHPGLPNLLAFIYSYDIHNCRLHLLFLVTWIVPRLKEKSNLNTAEAREGFCL
jgi:hypothetical protein